MAGKPEVFIVESVDLDDEVEDRFEGKMLTEMLRLGGKKPLYFYVRTKRELKEALRLFEKSDYRYLHLSCHGNDESICTTLDQVSFPELGALLNPYLEERRLFMSSCETVNDQLARAVMQGSGCFSVSGPTEEVDFDKAAILWASFYHLAFKDNEKRWKGKVVRNNLKRLARLFGVSVAYCGRDSSLSEGYYFELFPGGRRTTKRSAKVTS